MQASPGVRGSRWAARSDHIKDRLRSTINVMDYGFHVENEDEGGFKDFSQLFQPEELGQ